LEGAVKIARQLGRMQTDAQWNERSLKTRYTKCHSPKNSERGAGAYLTGAKKELAPKKWHVNEALLHEGSLAEEYYKQSIR